MVNPPASKSKSNPLVYTPFPHPPTGIILPEYVGPGSELHSRWSLLSASQEGTTANPLHRDSDQSCFSSARCNTCYISSSGGLMANV
jgi:hypothetical protein